MKTIIKISAVLSTLLISCTSMQQSAVNDDLYYLPTDKSSSDLYAFDNAETKTGKTYVFNKELDKKISDLLNDTLVEKVDTVVYTNEDNNLIVDSYDEALQKRIEARETNGALPNFLITSASDYSYAMLFIDDPYYNVVFYGDQVWVEPRWISTSFGFYTRPYYRYYGYFGYYDPYYYDPFYYSYYRPYYYNYYRPYYYPYYYGHPYYSINNYYYGDNNNWASSGNNSFRRRGTTTTNPEGINRSSRGSRSLPENYIGNDIRKTRTLKEGIDDQAARTYSEGRTDRIREKREGIQDPERTTRVSGNENTRTRQEITRKRTSVESNTNRTYTRTTRQGTSTYDASKRSASTRYTRPESSATRERSTVGTRSTAGSSGYSPNRTSTPTRSTSGGSKYTPARSSSGNSSGTVKSSPSRSSSGSSGNSSGSSRSSGSSGNSGHSSGSSSRGRR